MKKKEKNIYIDACIQTLEKQVIPMHIYIHKQYNNKEKEVNHRDIQAYSTWVCWFCVDYTDPEMNPPLGYGIGI